MTVHGIILLPPSTQTHSHTHTEHTHAHNHTHTTHSYANTHTHTYTHARILTSLQFDYEIIFISYDLLHMTELP